MTSRKLKKLHYFSSKSSYYFLYVLPWRDTSFPVSLWPFLGQNITLNSHLQTADDSLSAFKFASLHFSHLSKLPSPQTQKTEHCPWQNLATFTCLNPWSTFSSNSQLPTYSRPPHFFIFSVTLLLSNSPKTPREPKFLYRTMKCSPSPRHVNSKIWTTITIFIRTRHLHLLLWAFVHFHTSQFFNVCLWGCAKGF